MFLVLPAHSLSSYLPFYFVDALVIVLAAKQLGQYFAIVVLPTTSEYLGSMYCTRGSSRAGKREQKRLQQGKICKTIVALENVEGP